MTAYNLTMEATRLSLSLIVSGGVLLAILRFGGKKLLEHQFNAALEDVRAKQAQSLERLRFDISASLDRTTKLHQFEFEVLPEAWSRLHIAGGSCRDAVQRIISRIQVASLTDGQLSIVLSDLGIAQIDSDHIKTLAGENRQETFDKALDYHRWNIARRDHAEYYNYLLSHGIFVQKPMLEKLKAIGKLISDAVSEYGNALNYPPPPGDEGFKARNAFHAEWASMIGTLEGEVHARLWDARLVAIDQRGRD